MYTICTLIVINFLYTPKRQTIILAINSLDLFSEGFGVYENIYTYKSLMVHTACIVVCLVGCPLSPHVNIFLSRTRVFSTGHLEVGRGHRSAKEF